MYMKKLILTFASILSIGLGYSSNTSNSFSKVSIVSLTDETVSFKVSGTTACKSQIETIITSLDGVKSANWDADSKIITIVFDAGTVKKDRFFVALAEGGYDNQELHAKKSNYEELPAACKYTREAEND